ncbi:MAG: hypothetical protein K1X67_15275 [Fimbriimonadaceae bacterium]|nr:hypothetical protein [Fimbriimonadaceae bacterium]
MSAAASAYGNDGLIRFEFNVPVHVALKYGEGKPIEGRYGESLLFSTVDGRRFFLPMAAGQQLTALGVKPGEPITITKVENRVGRKISASYKVERDGVLAVPAASVTPRPMATAATPGPAALVAMPSPAGEPVAAPGNVRRYLYDTYKVAVDVLIEVQKYAHARELPITFGAEDVRSLAATILIQKGGSAWPR